MAFLVCVGCPKGGGVQRVGAHGTICRNIRLKSSKLNSSGHFATNVFDPLFAHTHFSPTNFPLSQPYYQILTTNVQTVESQRHQVGITSNFRKWIRRSLFLLRNVYSLQLRLLTMEQCPVSAKPQISSVCRDRPSVAASTAPKATVLPTNDTSAFL